MNCKSSVLAAVSLAVAVLISGPAKAVFEDGNKLHSECQSADGSFNRGFCVGYMIGVVDVMLGQQGQHLGWRMCLPSQVKVGQAADVAIQYLEKNPSLRHFTANSSVARALSKAWPCPKK